MSWEKRVVITGLVSLINLLFLFSLSVQAQKAGRIVPVLRIQVEDVEGGSRLRVNSDNNLTYNLKKTGNLLTISFRSAAGLRLEKKPFSSRLIASVDLAKSPEAYLLMIKTRTEDFTYTHSARRSPFELTVDLRNEQKPTPRTENRSAQISEKPPEEPAKIPTTVSRETAERPLADKKTIKTIVIDPGHGGNESGARGTFGTLEKDITLSISKKLKEEIEKGLRYRVVMTREADVSVPLDRRAAIANNNKADLFISIHINGARRTNARGSETFFLSLKASDEDSRRLAYFENNSEELENRVPEKDFDELKMILWDMAQSAYLKQSSQLAEFVQMELNELLNTRNRGVKQAPFKVLTGVACPAILVEVAFITNPEEEKLLQSEEFQTRVAEAIYRGLNRFLQLYEKP
jgi:N-acetylmuramoyl-L-alanine amidase